MAIEVVLPVSEKQSGQGASVASHNWQPLPPQPVIGLIDNAKTGAAELLDAVGRSLVRRGMAASYFVWQKASASFAISHEERAMLLARARVIVSGVGD